MPPKKRQSSGRATATAAKHSVKENLEAVQSEESSNEESEEEEESDNDDDGDDDDDDNVSGDDDGSGNDDDDDDDDDDDNDDDNDDDEESGEEEMPKKRARTGSNAKATKVPDKTKSSSKVAARSKKTVVKKSAATTKKKATSKAKAGLKSKKASLTREVKIKVMTKPERLEEARKAYKWWEAPKLPNGINWRRMEQPGINFAPAYEKHGVPLLYDGKPVELNSEQEEVASFFAAMPLDGPQLGNPTTRPVFERNFFEDFREVLGAGHFIKEFDKCDFSRIREHLDLQRSLRKAATDEEKAAKKAEKETLLLKYGYALIDGRLEKMGNFNMEPPGLFRGRGEHPKTGKLKVRCFAESVSLNLSQDACVPICSMPGHAWHSVRHDPSVTWLCGWNENVQNQNKYVQLAASSSFKGQSDMDKYSKAILLKKHIGKVRKDYTKKIQSSDRAERQMGTAMWVIDVLALRVGGEKGEEEADTVGCCSLRVEHVTFNDDPDTYEIELEFLGKDSMLFKQSINFEQHGDLGKRVYDNLKRFCAKKDPSEDIFETLTPPLLNKHLQSLMKGLTAKVFRTFNASVTLEKELPSAESLRALTVQEKVARYNAANRQVAILCNHQKTVSKATETMFETLNEKLTTLKRQRDELIKWKGLVKSGKESKVPLRADDKDRVERVQAQLQRALADKERANTTEQKLSAAAAIDEAKAAQKLDQKRRFEEKHKFKSAPTLSSVESRIDSWAEALRKLETDIRNRDENKEVALGTSKINYMDPRISVAWCKRCEVPIDKIFAKTLRDKFNWAMAVPPEWLFE